MLVSWNILPGETISLNAVSIVHVPKNDALSHICTLDSAELEKEEYADIKSLSEGVVSNIIEDKNFGDPRSSPDYGRSKTARIQQIGDSLDQDTEEVIECIKHIRNRDEMEQNAMSLGRLYKKQSRSRGDALVVASYTYDGFDCAAILKIPYKEEVYQTGENDVQEAERIIEKEVDKSLIYPVIRLNSTEVDDTAMKSYQANTSRPADYWQDFAGLDRSNTPDEALFELVSKGKTPFIDAQSIQDLREKQADIDDAVLSGAVVVKIGEIQFRTELRNILDPEQFRISDNGETTSIELRGRQVRIQAKRGNREYPLLRDSDE